MATKFTSTPVVLQAPYHVVFDVVMAALPTIPMAVEAADPATGVITATSKVSMSSWGERLTLQLGAVDASRTSLIVESKLSFGLVDWGKNKKNVDRVFAAVQARLGVAPPPA